MLSWLKSVSLLTSTIDISHRNTNMFEDVLFIISTAMINPSIKIHFGNQLMFEDIRQATEIMRNQTAD